jgi:hypothetical protein
MYYNYKTEGAIRLMDTTFINFTNHPSERWLPEQLAAAKAYGKIVDLPFPDVDPCGDEEYIRRLAGEYNEMIVKHRPAAVLCQGEMTLAFAVAARLVEAGTVVLAACSERVASEIIGGDGQVVKTAEFRFTRFRRYL